MLSTELYTKDIPHIYAEFADVVGERHWRQRVALLRQEIRGNRFLAHFHAQENSIAFQLERLAELRDQFGTVPLMACNNQDIYPAVAFATQILSYLKSSDHNFAERMRRRVHGAFKNPSDLKAIRLELTAATHFLRRNKKVSWPELTGEGTFDLLVEGVGSDGLEVECKAFTQDKGRKVTRRQALDFFGLLWARHGHQLRAQVGGFAAVLTVPQHLPTEFKERQKLADAFAGQIMARQCGNLLGGVADMQVGAFDIQRLQGIAEGRPIGNVRELFDDITGTKNREVAVVGTRGGALAIAIQSELDDTLLESIFSTFKASATKQLSGSRSAMFMGGIELDSSQLLEIAEQDQDPKQGPTGLQLETSRFLASKGHDHVVGIGFLSTSTLRPTVGDTVESGGTAYYFPKRESPYWSEDFSGLFAWRGDVA